MPTSSSSLQRARRERTEDASDAYYEAELNELGLKCIEVYQIQSQIVNRLWFYFNQHSGTLVLLGIAVATFRYTEAIQRMPLSLLLLVPLIPYVLFSFGNHQALTHTISELRLLRNIAQSRTRLRLEGSSKAKMLRFHLGVLTIAVVIYATCCLFAKNYLQHLR